MRDDAESPSATEPEPAYRLGCPVFGARSWVGPILPAGTPAGEQLAAYARLFSTVEGNGTFYGLPSAETVARWLEQTPPRFRFAFKVPRRISHDLALVGFERELAQLEALFRPLADRLGPWMLQLPPTAGRAALPRVERFLDRASDAFRWSVELRHPDWFDGGVHERDLHRALARRGAERVCLDPRALRAGPAEDASTRAARDKKPRVPPRFVGLGPTPVVRLIGRNDPDRCDAVCAEWAPVVARWIEEGRRPFVFCHAPDEHHAPALCRRFHDHLRRHAPRLPPLPEWPLPPRGPQLRLL